MARYLLLLVPLLAHLTPAVWGTVNPEWCSRQCTCLVSYRTVDCTLRHLTAVPDLSNLTINLYLMNNDIPALPVDAFSDLEHLEILDMENNSFTAASSDNFCGLANLKTLNLSRNKLRTLTVANNITEDCRLPSLTQLLLSDNDITEIPEDLPSWAPALETLNISYNRLGSLLFHQSFSTLKDLRILDLRGNPISEILVKDFSPLRGLPLSFLSLSECQLYHVEVEAFDGLTNLVSLSLSKNGLPARIVQDIFQTLGNSSRLTLLDLSEMVLPNITVSMLGMLSHLTSLNLFESSVKVIEPELFNLLPDLESLNLGRNELTNVTNLSALSKLRRLSMDWNHLQSVDVVDLTHLETIDISGNKLTQLPAHWLGLKTNLQVLNISHNEITSVDPQTFQDLSIQDLDLSYNKLEEVDGTGLKRLNKMYLSHNRLSSLTLQTFSNLYTTLEHIDLSYNNLTNLPHGDEDYVALQELNLAQNNLGSSLSSSGLQGYFQTLGRLQKLDLSGNGISGVARNQFRYLHHLTTIDLSKNSIADITDARLREVVTLTKLVMSDNLLTSVRGDALQDMDHLEELDLSGNPFNCTYCSLHSFLDWQNRSVVMIIHRQVADKYTCFSPKDVKGQCIFEYSPSPPPDSAVACQTSSHGVQTPLDWAMVGVAVSGVSVFLTLAAVLLFYGQICHKIKSLHYRWQIRYREVSGVEFTSEPHVKI